MKKKEDLSYKFSIFNYQSIFKCKKMLTNFKRIITFAVKDFTRSKGISLATIFVLIISILLVTWLFFFHGVSDYLVEQIKSKIDITAYLKEDVAEENILAIKEEILKLSPDIKNVQYVSRDDAFQNFNEKHQGSSVLIKALEEVGSNPFLPSLNITTSGDSAMYEEVSNILQTSDFSRYIEKVDFSEKKDTIEKVFSITSNVNKFTLILGLVLILVAVSVVFSTIKLAIDSSKDEISTMRIVGASDWFIRGPFIIQGAIYGIVAFLVCILLSGILSYFLSSKMAVVLPGFDAFGYFLTNFWFFVLIQLGFGIAVGVVSSFIAVKKYLEL